MTDAPIKSVFLEAPRREDEFQTTYGVGQAVNFWRESRKEADGSEISPPMESIKITRIAFREENRGTHGIGWYDVWAGDVLITSLNERYVVEVYRDLPAQVPNKDSA